jgi:Tfp pilus assembly protein PilX
MSRGKMMRRNPEKGVAMIMALILILVLSVMAVSLMFVSQTETWSSLNYRLMAQARDGAEAGVNSAANFIRNNYTEPGTTADPLSAYNYKSVWPVQVGAANTSGNDVYLSANSGQASNYPVSSVQTAFNTSGAGKGSFTSGNVTVNYKTYARLLSMTNLNSTVPGTSSVNQTWEITSDGTIDSVRSATVEVSAILEQTIVPTFNYVAFATNNGCSALTFGGGGTTDSFDSSTYGGSGTPVTTASGGSVGTNGNLSTVGNPTNINGNLATPRTGTGSCSSNNVTAWTNNSGHVNGSIVQLPQPVAYPNPPTPNPVPPTTSATLNNHSSDCTGVTGCTYSGGDFYLAPGGCPPSGTPATYGDITVKGNVHLSGGCYNFNSVSENGQGKLMIDSGIVIMNITGTGQGTPVDLTGGGVVNSATPAYNPLSFQIVYGGAGAVKLAGGANAVGLMYAPNATYSLTGGSNWYGALIGATLTDMGGTALHYDRRLQHEDFVPGNWTLESFTWKKY